MDKFICDHTGKAGVVDHPVPKSSMSVNLQITDGLMVRENIRYAPTWIQKLIRDILNSLDHD